MLAFSLTKLACRQAQRHLSVQRDHVDTPLTEALEAHLVDCESCRRFAAAMNTPAPQPLCSGTDGALVYRALRAWERETPATASRRRNPWLYPGIAAAAAGLTVSGVWVANRQAFHTDNKTVETVAVAPKNSIDLPRNANQDAAPEAKPPRRIGDLRNESFNSHRKAQHPQRPQLLAANRRKSWGDPLPAPVILPVPSSPPMRRTIPVAASVGSIDDMTFVNQKPPTDLNTWADMAPDEQLRLEQQIRSSLKTGDDFVRVPFPRLAALNNRLAVDGASASFRREASIVDARLQRSVSLSAKQVPFTQFCETLTDQTGITFAADPGIADENIVLYCTNCTLRDVMRQISRHFGFTWRREGAPGNHRYIISQELPAQIAEEELKNRDRGQALLALDADMQKYRPYLSLTPDQIVEQYKADRETCFATGESWIKASAAEKLLLKKEGKDPSSINKWLNDRQNLWETLGNYRWGAIHLYFSLTPEQRAALGRGETVQFTSMPLPGEYALPSSLEKGVRQSLRGVRYSFSKENAESPNYWSMSFDPRPLLDEVLGVGLMHTLADDPKANSYHATPLTAKPGLIAVSVYLRISQREPGIFDLQAGAGTGKVKEGKVEGYSAMNSAAATGISPSVRTPVSRPWDGVPASMQRQMTRQVVGNVTFPVTAHYAVFPLRIEDDGNLSKADWDETSVADAWERVHWATGQNILSDGFSYLIDPKDLPSIRGKALPDALSALSAALGQRWRAGEGENGKPWVLARSASFFNDRSREVPRRLLKDWAAKRKERGYSSLEEITEMAQLSDAQLDSKNAREMAIAVYGLREWEIASTANLRWEWRLYNTLTEEQQHKIWTSPGLYFKELTQEQQDVVIKHFHPSGLPQFQRDLYVQSGRFVGKYTTIPEAEEVTRSYIGKPKKFLWDSMETFYQPRVVMMFTYGEEGKANGSTYSYGP